MGKIECNKCSFSCNKKRYFKEHVKMHQITDIFLEEKNRMIKRCVPENCKISILMPIYNGIEFINESVTSVINQSHDHWELIIGINGHPQNSNIYKTALKYQDKNKINVLDLHNVKGKSEALNEMLKYSNYDHIALLDVDDIWLPEKLEKQIPFIYKYDVVGSMCSYFGDKLGSPELPIGRVKTKEFVKHNPIINSSSIIKKELCHWDSDMDGIEDYELWLDIWQKNGNFYNCSEVLVKHQIHKASCFNGKNNGNIGWLISKYFSEENIIKLKSK